MFVLAIMFPNQTLTTPSTANPMKDFEVTSAPDDSISALAFSPATLPQNFLVAGSWDNNVSKHLVFDAKFVYLVTNKSWLTHSKVI